MYFVKTLPSFELPVIGAIHGDAGRETTGTSGVAGVT